MDATEFHTTDASVADELDEFVDTVVDILGDGDVDDDRVDEIRNRGQTLVEVTDERIDELVQANEHHRNAFDQLNESTVETEAVETVLSEYGLSDQQVTEILSTITRVNDKIVEKKFGDVEGGVSL